MKLYPVVQYLSIAFSFGTGQGLQRNCQYFNRSPGKGIYLYGVKCQYADLGGIPSDFKNNINYLEIENDNINQLTASSLLKYPELKYLLLKHAGIMSIEDEAFLLLPKLLHLDLSGNAITKLSLLPSSLETLCLNSMPNSTQMFSDSAQIHERVVRIKSSLKVLQIRNNALQFMPTFIRELRMLKSVLVNKNKIQRLTIDDVAPLCNLEELDFSENEISSKVERYMCDCTDLKKWILEKRGTKIYGLICPQFGMNQEQCDDKYGKDLAYRLPEYYECRVITFLSNYWFYLVCGMVVSSIFIAFCFCSYSNNRRKMKPENGNQPKDTYTRVEVIAEEETELRK